MIITANPSTLVEFARGLRRHTISQAIADLLTTPADFPQFLGPERNCYLAGPEDLCAHTFRPGYCYSVKMLFTLLKSHFFQCSFRFDRHLPSRSGHEK